MSDRGGHKIDLIFAMRNRMPRSFVAMITPVLVGVVLIGTWRPATAAERDISTAQRGQVELLGIVQIPGDQVDASDLAGTLSDGSAINQLGGFSALDYDDRSGEFVVLSDRGAGDGAVEYPCRFHTVSIDVPVIFDRTADLGQNLAADHLLEYRLVNTIMLRGENGESLLGSLTAREHDWQLSRQSAVDGKNRGDRNSGICAAWTAMDAEGIRIRRDGSLLISEEYGPRLVIANRNGTIESEVPIPQTYLADPLEHSPLGYPSNGCFANRGFEGISLASDDDHFVAVPQSALTQDGVVESGKCRGLNCRWLIGSLTSPETRQFIYTLEDDSHGVSEILTFDKTHFLVLERDGKGGQKAKCKRIYLVDIRGASDVSALNSLPPDSVPSGVTTVRKELLIDLLDPRFNLAGDTLPEKPEGLCWGPDLPDGRRTLWICCDNDFIAANPSIIYCFAVQ